MRTSIFRKARITYHSGLVILNVESKEKEYYDVGDLEDESKYHSVVIEQTGSGVTFSCDCTHQSLHCKKRVFCEHIISVINYKYFRDRRRNERKD